jgi:hypothetical protein
MPRPPPVMATTLPVSERGSLAMKSDPSFVDDVLSGTQP